MFSSDKNTSEARPITTTSSARITNGPAWSATSTSGNIRPAGWRGRIGSPPASSPLSSSSPTATLSVALSCTSSCPDSSLPGTDPPSGGEGTPDAAHMQWEISYISFPAASRCYVATGQEVVRSVVEQFDIESVRASAAGRRLTERQPLADDVHDVLVDMLMNHTLGAGSRLNIDALAKTLGVS